MSRARLATLTACLLIVAACGGSEVPPPGPRPTPTATTGSASPSSSPSPSPDAPSPTPTISPTIRLPDDAPTTFRERLPAGDVPLDALIPPGASVIASWIRPEDDAAPGVVALGWMRGEDAFAAEVGVVVWQASRDRPPWRAVYAFTDPPARGVLGVRLEPGDLTGDGLADLLTFEALGGSGACGTWRVVVLAAAGATEAWRHRGCDTDVRPGRGRLDMREAVFEPGDPHCCPSAFRISRLRWNGSTFVEVRSVVSPNPATG